MGWIQTRIEAEFRKHPRLEWARIAEAKIIIELNDRGLLRKGALEDVSLKELFKNIDLAGEELK